MKKNNIIRLALIALFTFTFLSCQQQSKSTESYSTVSVADFKHAIDQQQGIILDVRTPEEFAEGHLPGAMNIDINGTDFKEQIEKLDKSKNYEVYCRSGKRSAKASAMMAEKGFVNVINLDGGILSWQEKGFPVEK